MTATWLAVILAALAAALALLWWRERAALDRLTAGFARLNRANAERTAEAEAARRASEAIIDALPDPLLLLGPDRAVTRTNAAARSLFGADIAAVLRHPGLRAAIERMAETRTSVSAELEFAVPVERAVQASVIPLTPPLPDGTQAMVVLSDRSRERAVERMRADFVANASHELRTPLTSLIGFIDTIRGPAADDPPAQKRFLAIMAEQGGRMHRLIDDLLSLSRIELNEHIPPGETVDLAQLIRSVAAGFEPRLAGGKVRLVQELADGLPMIAGDSDQLAQVLTNLIENAVKYGADGGVVRITAAPATPPRWPARAGIVVAVIDQGAGIPRAHLPRLTERFYRVDKARSRGAGGTGLGLAIVKHIINRHRGQLSIESEEGKGTTVSVWLPAVD